MSDEDDATVSDLEPGEEVLDTTFIDAGDSAADAVDDAHDAVAEPVSTVTGTVTGALSVASPVLQAVTQFTRVLTNAQPTFRFIVLVNGAPYGIFTECDLPVVGWETQNIKEGGLNTYTHQLLGRRKESSMTFKNGVGTSAFIAWYLLVMGGVFNIPALGLRRAVTVILLNPLKIPVMVWHVSDAMPTEWSGPQLKTSDNSIAIQTLKLICGDVTIIPGVGF